MHWNFLRPNSLAVITDLESYSWSFLNNQISCVAYYLSKQGLKIDQTVAILANNSIDLLFCQLAVIANGSKVLLLNPSLPYDLLKDLFIYLNIDFLIDFEYNEKYIFNCPKLDYSNYRKYKITNNFRLVSFSKIVKQPAILILTSGSTNGQPKAVVHNILAYLNSAYSVLNLINYQQSDCWLLSLPLFHVSGQGILWRWLVRGGVIALKSKSSFELHNISHISLVPTQLFKFLKINKNMFSSLKAILLGGEMIPTILTKKIACLGISCWNSYGITEMASTVCAKLADGKNGVGLPLIGKQVRLIKNEIQIKSNSQALGYWVNGKIIPLNCTDGWFNTRDKGVFINNEYHILGRLDNLFISGGECVQPEYIEKIINSHPYVIQSFIIPIKDDKFGQRPVAVLELEKGSLIGDVAKWLKYKLAPYQYPVAFYSLIPELKSNRVKVSRQQIKNWLLK
ncbi:2-succinylbenzoate--CoA ligase [Candidatus Providencia siddallii]|uniref:2-succinylbenzoate--CoA ligase n=1 Tax=Candidatus Providencia siddallii TaxID=1715285 RepID=A0A0M6W910_9GAMM|nr:2-succinylbenzoate--CoA ligase [Candidatus Providencia siddallii]